MKTRARNLVVGLLVSVLLLACGLPSSLTLSKPTSTPTKIPTPTHTPFPPPTATPTVTPTAVPAVRVESGDRALFIGDWENALQEFETAKSASNDPEIQSAALLGIGKARLLERSYDEAISTLEELVKDYPDSLELSRAYFLLGQAYNAQEKYSLAAEAYGKTLDTNPGVIDAYILDRRGDARYAAGDYAGAAQDYLVAAQAPSLLDGTFLQMKTARADALAGDTASALKIYEALYTQTSDDNTRALIDLRKGQIYTTLGQKQQALAAFKDAVDNYPRSYDTFSALVALVDAGAEVDPLQRGMIDYFAGQYGVALSAFDHYLQGKPENPSTAFYYYALTNRALGNSGEAIKWWDKIILGQSDQPLWADAWDQKATTQWAYLDQYDQAAQTLLTFVKNNPGHPRAGEFLFDAAQVAERGGSLKQAAELWGRVPREYPNYEQARRAFFLAGITHYRLEDYPSALSDFLQYSALATAMEDKAQAQLWIGKTQQALGNEPAAQEAWTAAAGIDPTGYYSERARDILHNRQPFAPPLGYDLMFDKQAERVKAEQWVRTTFGLPDNTDLTGLGALADNAGLKRGAELWNLGLLDDARAEFEQVRLSVQADAAQSYRLANYLIDLGAYRSGIMATRQVLELATMDDASTLNAPLYFNHLRFGAYFSDVIMPLAQKYGFHPLFLFSLVRQESLFEGFASSTANARGLMQIIPSTGDNIAKKLNWPPDYSAEDLFRPMVNLNLGVEYLDTQRTQFDGDMYAALAAYNGGPLNAKEWRDLAPGDPDLFLEVIRYEETRNYVRGISELFNIYRLLYNRSS